MPGSEGQASGDQRSVPGDRHPDPGRLGRCGVSGLPGLGTARGRSRAFVPGLVVLFLASFRPAGLHAVPAPPLPQVVDQPDGSRLMLRVHGDEWFRYHTTLDGVPVVRDGGTSRWNYAQLDAAGGLESTGLMARTQSLIPKVLGLSTKAPPVPARNKQLMLQARSWALMRSAGKSSGAPAWGSSKFLNGVTGPLSAVVNPAGTVKNLVILANFSDTTPTFSRQNFDGLFNTPGFQQFGAKKSVRDYYQEVSYGTMTLQTTVVGWIQLPQTRAYYGANSGGFDVRPREMVRDAILGLEAQGFDFRPFDANNDGWIDSFGVIHQGIGEEEASNDPDAIWSHKWALSSPITVDGVRIYDYHTEPEILHNTSNITAIGVICHETGHFFGLPDLYDTDYSSHGVGRWSIMAGGSWNDEGHNPAHFDAWCKVRLGWVQPAILRETRSGYGLSQVATTAAIVRLDANMPSGQYFLLENRQRVGSDQYLPGAGLLIWRIDDTLSSNSNENHPLVQLKQADGELHLENRSNSGDGGDPFPGSRNNRAFNGSTSPNSNSYAGPTGIAVSGLSDSGSTMSFNVNFGFDVQAITPSTATNEAAGVFTISGAGFSAGASARLSRSGSADIPGTAVTVMSGTEVRATFDLTGVATGSWSVVVTNGDGSTVTLPGGLAVIAPPSTGLVEDFEGGLGDWTGTGLWHLVTTGTGNSYALARDGTRSVWYGRDGTGTYNTGAASTGTLTSPSFRVPQDGRLRFWSWEKTESTANYDTRKVYIEDAGGTRRLVLTLNRNQSTWTEYTGLHLSTYAGQVARLVFVFDTIDHVDNNHRGWYVDDIRVEGTVTTQVPDVSVTPASLAFGNVTRGSTAPAGTVTVGNSGTSSLTVTAITRSGSPDFSLAGLPVLPAIVAPGATLSFQVGYRPAEVGADSGTVTLASNDPDEGTVAVTLSGTGTGIPDIVLTPPSIDFGSVAVGSSSDVRSVTIQNAGDGPLTLAGIQITPTGAFELAGAPALPASVAPGQTLAIGLRYTPARAGSDAATVAFASNDPDEASVAVGLAGTGQVPLVVVGFSEDFEGSIGGWATTGLWNRTDLASGSPYAQASSGTRSMWYGSPSNGTYYTGSASSGELISPAFTVPAGATLTFRSWEQTEYSTYRDLKDVYVLRSGGSRTLLVQCRKNTARWESYGASLADWEGQQIRLVFRFDTLDFWNNFYRGWYVDQIRVEGVVTSPVPDVTVDPTSLAFGTISRGSVSPERTVTIANSGTGPLTIRGLTGAGGPEFTVAGAPALPASLAPGGSLALGVTYRPIDVGPDTGSLSIASDDPDEDGLTVSFAGTGIGVPDVAVTPGSVPFGTVPVGSTAEQFVTIANAGDGTLQVTGLTTTGPFQVISPTTFPRSVAAGSNLVAMVRFAPVAAGAAAANLTVTTDDPDEGSVTAGLAGTGQGVPDVAVAPTSLAFGDVPRGTAAPPRTITVTSSGSGSLRLTAISRTGSAAYGLTGIPELPAILAPGATTTVQVSYRPPVAGPDSGAVVIASDDPDRGTVTIPLSGTGSGIPEVAVSPASLAFPAVAVGSTATLVLTVENSGDGALQVTGLAAGGAFQVVSPAAVPAPVAAGASLLVTVRFAPTTVGPLSGTLTLTTNDPDEGTVNVPLGGTGTGVPDVAVSPASVAFGDVTRDTSTTPATVTVSNAGTATLTVTSITRSGSADFTLVGVPALPTALAPGASLTFQVGYRPAAVGPESAAVTLVSDDPDQGSAAIPLTGTGTGIPDVAVTPASLDFGTRTVGTASAVQTVTVANAGDGPLILGAAAVSPTGEFALVSGPGLPATVAAGGAATFGLRYTPANAGSDAGTLTLTGDDPDEPSVTVALAGTGEAPPVAPGFTEDFEGSIAGWATTGLWNRADLSSGSPYALAFSGTRSMWYGSPSNGTYYTGSANSGELISPAFTVPPGATLTFRSWEQTEYSTYRDLRNVYVLQGGGSRSLLVQCQRNSARWESYSASLAAWEGQPVRLVFRFDTLDFWNNFYRGWYVDRVEVAGVVTIPVPDIAVTPAVIGFGEVVKGTSAPARTVTIANTGTAALTITAVTRSGSDAFSSSQVPALPATIAAGATATFQVAFAPPAVGTHGGAITIASDDPDESPVTVALTGSGTGIPEVAVSPASLGFGSVAVGSTVEQPLTVANQGDGPLHVTGVTTVGPFQVLSPTSFPHAIAPGSNLVAIVRFAPVAVGPAGGGLTIATNDPDETSTTVSLAGTGLGVPDIVVSPAGVAFGTILRGSVAPARTVTISNAGSATLQVSAITLTGSAGFSLGQVPALPASIAAGASLGVQVGYQPVGVGSDAATVTIVSDDPDQPDRSIPVSGTGAGIPDVTVNPVALDFGNVPAGTASAIQSIAVQNVGDGPLVLTGAAFGPAGEFALAGAPAFPVSIAPGAGLTLGVRYAPADIGSDAVTLTLSTSDPDEGSVAIALAGTGEAPPVVPGFTEDFEGSMSGWTTTGLWHRTDRAGGSPYAQSQSGTKAMWYGSPSNGTYYTGSANAGELISPPFTVPAGATLSFSSWEQVEYATYRDLRDVYVHRVTAGRSLLVQCRRNTSRWESYTASLAPWEGEQIQLVFRFDTLDFWNNFYRGWFVDTVHVTGITAAPGAEPAPAGIVDSRRVDERELRKALDGGELAGLLDAVAASGARRLVLPGYRATGLAEGRLAFRIPGGTDPGSIPPGLVPGAAGYDLAPVAREGALRGLEVFIGLEPFDTGSFSLLVHPGVDPSSFASHQEHLEAVARFLDTVLPAGVAGMILTGLQPPGGMTLDLDDEAVAARVRGLVGSTVRWMRDGRPVLRSGGAEGPSRFTLEGLKLSPVLEARIVTDVTLEVGEEMAVDLGGNTRLADLAIDRYRLAFGRLAPDRIRLAVTWVAGSSALLAEAEIACPEGVVRLTVSLGADGRLRLGAGPAGSDGSLALDVAGVAPGHGAVQFEASSGILEIEGLTVTLAAPAGTDPAAGVLAVVQTVERALTRSLLGVHVDPAPAGASGSPLDLTPLQSLLDF